MKQIFISQGLKSDHGFIHVISIEDYDKNFTLAVGVTTEKAREFVSKIEQAFAGIKMKVDVIDNSK